MADAVIIPGRRYSADAPLLAYAADVTQRRGATNHRVSWSGEPPDFPAMREWIAAQVTPVLDGAGRRPLVIGKSLGSLAAPVAVERDLPAVWLTPLLTVPWLVEALDRATAPFLLVGGTGDSVWDGDLARRLTPHVLEVAEADHGMYVPGALTDSIAVLARVVTAVQGFLDAIDWPATAWSRSPGAA